MRTTFITKVIVFVMSVNAQHLLPYMSSYQQLPAINLITDQNEIVTNRLHIGPDVPLYMVPYAVVDVPIPVNIPFYPGPDKYKSNCNREEIVVGYGKTCQKLLQKGNCKIDEVVVIDPITMMGVCVPRLCPVDRVFVVATQLCHDPRDTSSLCPGKRELRYTAFGTAICDCPVGTVADSNGTTMYGDACKPIFNNNNSCPIGQLFWSKDFQSPPQCILDPCLKFNMYANTDTLQYVPHETTGICYQLGSTTGVCPEGTIYALHLPDLKGVCETFENLGFDVFSPEELAMLKALYGPTTVRDSFFGSSGGYNAPSTTTETYGQLASVKTKASLTSNGFGMPSQKLKYGIQAMTVRRPTISTQSMNNFMKRLEDKLLHSLVSQYRTAAGILEIKKSVQLSGNEANEIYPNFRRPRSISNEVNPHLEAKCHFLRIEKDDTNINKILGNTFLKRSLRRFKRQLGKLLFATSSNIYETQLLSCKAGARRDFNNKCQETVLPVRNARSIGVVPLPPIPPRPMCPQGQKYNVLRKCTSDASFYSKRAVGGLG